MEIWKSWYKKLCGYKPKINENWNKIIIKQEYRKNLNIFLLIYKSSGQKEVETTAWLNIQIVEKPTRYF